MEIYRPFKIFCESKNYKAVEVLVKELWDFYKDDVIPGLKPGVPTFQIFQLEQDAIDLSQEGDRKALFYNPDLNEELGKMAEAYARRHPLVLTIHVGFLEGSNLPYNLKNIQPSTADKLSSNIMLVSGDFILELNQKVIERFANS